MYCVHVTPSPLSSQGCERQMCVCVYVCVLYTCITESVCASLCVVDAVGWWRVQAVFRGGSWGPWESRGGSRRGRWLLRVRVLQREVVNQRSASTHRQRQRSTSGREERDRVTVCPDVKQLSAVRV